MLDSASTPYQCRYITGRTWAALEGSARKAFLAGRTFHFQFGGVGEDGRGPDEEAMRKRLTYVRMDVVAASLRSAVHVSNTSAENCMHP